VVEMSPGQYWVVGGQADKTSATSELYIPGTGFKTYVPLPTNMSLTCAVRVTNASFFVMGSKLQAYFNYLLFCLPLTQNNN
jgi:hypothetical protein